MSNAATKVGHSYAGVAELVDAPDLESGALGRVGSNPTSRTIFFKVTGLESGKLMERTLRQP